MLEASKKCHLKKKKQSKILNTKPWFDKECSDIKQKITEMGKKLRGDRENKDLRKELFQLKIKLKKTVRKKKRAHKKSILQKMELCTSTSQKKYWNLLGKLEEKENNTIHYVSSMCWSVCRWPCHQRNSKVAPAELKV